MRTFRILHAIIDDKAVTTARPTHGSQIRNGEAVDVVEVPLEYRIVSEEMIREAAEEAIRKVGSFEDKVNLVVKLVFGMLALVVFTACDTGGGSASPSAKAPITTTPITDPPTTTVPDTTPSTTIPPTTTTTIPPTIVDVTYHRSNDVVKSFSQYCYTDLIAYCTSYEGNTYCWDNGFEGVYGLSPAVSCNAYAEAWSYWLGNNSGNDWLSVPTLVDTEVLRMMGSGSSQAVANILANVGSRAVTVSCFAANGVVTCPNFTIDTNQIPQ